MEKQILKKKKLISLSNLKILFSKKYNCMSKIFLKIDLKLYSNVTIHNQTHENV